MFAKSGPSLPPIVFVDRDGTLIKEYPYLSNPRQVRLLPGAAKAIRTLNQMAIPVALITNQSGIGRGLFTREQYELVHAELMRKLEEQGAVLAVHVCCPATESQDDQRRRKPSPKMFREAAARLGVEPRGSAFIGDQLRDVLPARHFGGTAWLVETGHTLPDRIPLWVRRVPTLLDAIRSLATDSLPTPGDRISALSNRSATSK